MVSWHGEIVGGEGFRELDRIGRGPDQRYHLAMESVLAFQFEDTQQLVHVITGSLKASGSFHGSVGHNNRWEGEIRYGGMRPYQRPVIPGPARERGPAHYAEYERGRGSSRNPGSNHDFMRNIVEYGLGESAYERIILGFLVDEL